MLYFYIYKHELHFNKLFILNTQKHLIEHKGKRGRLKHEDRQEITFSVLKYAHTPTPPPSKNTNKIES